jgi:hypothetical protein
MDQHPVVGVPSPTPRERGRARQLNLLRWANPYGSIRMRFSELFQTFSRRSKPAEPPRKRLTPAFRTRVLLRCRDVFGNAGLFVEFWTQIQSKLTYLHGTPSLHPASQAGRVSPAEDALTFLQTCTDDHFLDFIEIIFRVASAFRVNERETLVDDFNEFLKVDDLPYAVTGFIWTKGVATQFGQTYESTSLTGYPQVIRKDSELIHVAAVEPALTTLTDPRLSGANQELLAALKDYRRGNYGDCLTKCGSSFESVLKVICDVRGWPYQPNDTAGPLLKTVIANGGFESFLEQPLLLVATLRNRLSTAHGSGSTPDKPRRRKQSTPSTPLWRQYCS